MAENEYLSIKCPDCDSSQVHYDAERSSLICDNCGYTRDLPRNIDSLQESPLSDGFALGDLPTGLGVTLAEYACESCGAHRALDPEQIGATCPFCGSTSVEMAEQETEVVQPSGILPFTIPRQKAEAIFNAWLREGFFHPSNLPRQAKLHKITGVYLPFWTFDAYTRSTWHAMAGYKHMADEMTYDGQGNQVTQRMERIRWEPASGYYESFFDDVLVPASLGLPEEEFERVGEYPMEELVEYDSRYIEGWECEIYQKDLSEGLMDGEFAVNEKIREEIEKRIPGDSFQGLRVQTQKEGITFKHILLPIWLASYRYKGTLYRFLINGRTGEVAGDKPESKFKLGVIIVFAFIIIIALVFFLEKLL